MVTLQPLAKQPRDATAGAAVRCAVEPFAPAPVAPPVSRMIVPWAMRRCETKGVGGGGEVRRGAVRARTRRTAGGWAYSSEAVCVGARGSLVWVKGVGGGGEVRRGAVRASARGTPGGCWEGRGYCCTVGCSEAVWVRRACGGRSGCDCEVWRLQGCGCAGASVESLGWGVGEHQVCGKGGRRCVPWGRSGGQPAAFLGLSPAEH